MATASREKKQKLRPPKERIVPANPKYYDIEAAFSRSDEIDRKQVAGFRYRARMPQILWELPAGLMPGSDFSGSCFISAEILSV